MGVLAEITQGQVGKQSSGNYVQRDSVPEPHLPYGHEGGHGEPPLPRFVKKPEPTPTRFRIQILMV